MAENSLQTSGNGLIEGMEGFFAKAPNLPANIREVLVKIAPWLSLIFGILGILAGLGAVGLTPVAVVGGVTNSAMLLVSGVVTLVASVLMLMAFPKLNKRQQGGWVLLFWSEVVSVVGSVLSLSYGSILGAVIGALIGFYLLFQIKSYYK